MENTSISDLILPTPFNQKTSHNFQLVHSKANRFSVSDLYHLSILAFSGCLGRNLLWSCHRYCNKNSQPAPVFMCFIFLILSMALVWKTVIKKQSRCVTFHQNIFLSIWNIGRGFYVLLDFWRLCRCTVAWSSNYLEQKSQQFFQKTASVIIWHLRDCFHKNRAALWVARIGLKLTHTVKTP